MNNIQSISFLLFFLVISCSKKNITISDSDRNDNIFRYNESSSITSLDPLFANTQSNIWAVNQIFNTLVELDSNMNIQPSLAKEWFISNDGLTYTFHLRDDVCYHTSTCFQPDSTRLIKAQDFIFSISRLSNEEIMSPGSWVLEYLDLHGVKALNDTVLEINLIRKFPAFLQLLTMSYFSFIPHEAVDFFGDQFSQKPIGTGPFYLKYWRQNEKLVLLKNKQYFEYEEDYRLPYLDGVSISFITQKESVFMNFIMGNFDFVSGLDNSFRDEFLSSSGQLLKKYENQFSILSTPYLNTEYLGIHLPKALSEKSPLMFRDFRRAINYSFDKSIMTQHLRNGLVFPANKGFVPNALLNCYDIAGFDYSPDSVDMLLNSIPNKHKSITLHTTQDYLDICEYIQHSAKKFGINIDLEVSSPAIHRELFSSGEASFFRASWIADYPDPENFLSLFYSKNKSPLGPNYTHFNNSTYDSLYELSFQDSNSISRCNLFFEMESLLIEEAVVIPLYYDYAFRLVNKNIQGMSLNSMNTLSLKRVQKK